MLRVRVKTDPRAYEVRIASGLLEAAGREIVHAVGKRRCYIITVPRVQRLWGATLVRSLAKSGLRAEFLTLPDGERFKRLAAVERLAATMVRRGADRDSVVVAFGGGVVGDVAGLVAALYMRGVDLIQVPTTLLAQVDASVGGKTAVNLPSGKNLVGVFHQPRLVLVDPAVLSTLPVREFRAGLYEALKCGVIRNPALFGMFEKHRERILARDTRALTKVIHASIRVKAEVVSADEREQGLRRILNFGHTIGHALEAEGGYRRLLHGEAVAWGMMAATSIAEEISLLDGQQAERVLRAIASLGALPRVRVVGERILRRLQADKKTRNGAVHFVLPVAIGRAEVVAGVPVPVITRVLRRLPELHAAGVAA
jgi:3-dehydroquinate synthase